MNILNLSGKSSGTVTLPPIFDTPFRKDVIRNVYKILNTHKFQPQGRHPTAGMDVVADSNDPPTGRGVSRIAKMRGGGGGRQGQAGEVASIRGGRQAHPPKVEKVIYKKINKKEKLFALCSAIAATSSKDIVESRGHKVEKIKDFPPIVSDDIESVKTAKQMKEVLNSLNLTDDVKRLESRRVRSGKPALRGRGKKVGKSVLFVVNDSKMLTKACGGFPGVDVRMASDLSVLDLAPGSDTIRLTVYTKGALDTISKIKSPLLELAAKLN